MGLSREFLKGLELDKSTIDAIMSEYGSGETELKGTIAELKENNAELKADSLTIDRIPSFVQQPPWLFTAVSLSGAAKLDA